MATRGYYSSNKRVSSWVMYNACCYWW